MNRRELKKINTRIKGIKRAAQELKDLSSTIPAVNRNAERILASVKMLEINISDVLDLCSYLNFASRIIRKTRNSGLTI